MSWILTQSGRAFWPFAPRVEDVCIEDIAHALSMICRFNGHVKTFYSVAQHCVLASELVPQHVALDALLHDASEAYICDLPRPLKQHDSMVGYLAAERQLEATIRQAFGLSGTQMAEEVRAIDHRLLVTERRDLMPPGLWIVDEGQCLPMEIVPWSSAGAKKAFLRRFEDLTQ